MLMLVSRHWYFCLPLTDNSRISLLTFVIVPLLFILTYRAMLQFIFALYYQCAEALVITRDDMI